MASPCIGHELKAPHLTRRSVAYSLRKRRVLDFGLTGIAPLEHMGHLESHVAVVAHVDGHAGGALPEHEDVAVVDFAKHQL